jgi:DNA-binding transcriptional regulator YiaG
VEKIEKQQLLNNFLTGFNMSPQDFAMLMSMNKLSIKYWLSGEREMPDHVAKLLNMFMRNPSLLNEFY